MNQRQLGKNGPMLSEIGLGAWAIGGQWAYGWGEQDDMLSVRTIRTALDSGINWIDTAAVYGLGHSEKLIGETVKSFRDEVFIATKCGLVWDNHGRVARNNRPESIRRECDARLGTYHSTFSLRISSSCPTLGSCKVPRSQSPPGMRLKLT